MLSNPVKINIKSRKEKLANALQSYNLYNIDETFDKNEANEKQIIIQRIKDSNLVIIDQFIYNDKSDKYFVIGFQKTIIIIKDSSIKLLQSLFTNNARLQFYFLHNSKDIFDTNNDIKNNRLFQYSDNFDEEITNFSKSFEINHPCENTIFQMQSSIKSCISGYLIGESYFKLIEEQKIDFSTEFNKESNQKEGKKSNIKEWTEDEYIKLRKLDSGSLFMVSLIYQIETGHLFASKKASFLNDEEIPKLNTREYENYLAINYPLIPKFYGKQDKGNFLIIQYIHGQTLDTIIIKKLTLEDKITIMIELMLIIQYLHDKKFVYRDLKPNNVIFDENKTVFLIDFDRMIKLNSQSENENFTTDLQSQFIAPEVNSGGISYKNDIYSLGKMMEYLQLEKENDMINSLYQKCTNTTANQRPSVFDLISQFYSIFIQNFNKTFIVNFPEIKSLQRFTYPENKYIDQDINKSIQYLSFAANQNDPNAQYTLGVFYFEGKYISRDINKSIHYYSLAANQNHRDAQFNLGTIYLEGKYIKQDINKSIHYYSLAANQNDKDAQFNLGTIYLEGKYIKQDINKSIHYFSLAANQNHPNAQFALGVIYYEGKYIDRDVNKSIHYYSLAANQNHPYAQFALGTIYCEGKYVKRDINKSIQYYSLSANQNHPHAQINLGTIYSEGKYITRDINKSIHYFSLAANQNYRDAQFNLGVIYYEGKYIDRDVNKSIQYFSLAASQNDLESQYRLGLIYSEGKYIKQDINKSIYYYSLAANQNHTNAQINLGTIYYEGKYIDRDINKSIHYLSLAANQNHPDAQYNLGCIYYEGKYITRDINKSIHYLSLAADQNNIKAQFALGLIYSEGKYINRDINKSIHYYLLAANQNHPYAQINLGTIYSEGKYIDKDVNKSIHYYSLAANQNHPDAQFNLGVIYSEGKYIDKDINKSIYYYSLAANQNHPDAQFNLGMFYSHGIYYKENMVKAIDYFIQSASNGNIESHFVVGYFYHEGKCVERDIKKSIHHYKEASTFDNQYAKNNLGIIYRFGCGDEIQPNYGLSMDYFEEAIRRFQDKVSMYNLAHIYIYEDKNKDRLKKSIELLIESIKLNFLPSIELLCIALIKLFGLNIEVIREELNKLIKKSSKLSKSVYRMIIDQKLLYEPNYEQHYKSLSTINYLYDFDKNIISTKTFNEPKQDSINTINGENITQEFYEGFGIDLQ